MPITTQRLREAFDFSRDAQEFKQRLWNQLKEQMGTGSVQELEDDDLTWLNAAGTPFRSPEEEDSKQ